MFEIFTKAINLIVDLDSISQEHCTISHINVKYTAIVSVYSLGLESIELRLFNPLPHIAAF